MAVVYFVIWLAINGRITTETVLLGSIVSLLLQRFLQGFLPSRPVPFFSMLCLLPRGLLYLLTLLLESLKANLQVIRLVLSPVIEVNPCMVRFRTGLTSEAARVALANSITLASGAVTVSLEADSLLVHVLDRDTARGLDDSVFIRQLRRMEGAIPHA